MTDPNAVLNDTEFEWRYGRVPSYTKVNEAYEQGTRVMFILSWNIQAYILCLLLEKSITHEEGSLPWLVSNLVKVMLFICPSKQ